MNKTTNSTTDMTDPTAHPDWPTLNDYADDVLAPAERAAVSAHLGNCHACAATLDRIASLRSAAQALAPSAPVTAPVPEDSWDAVRAGIERGKVVPLPGHGGAMHGGHSRTRYLRFAAAAAFLVVASSAGTAWYLRRTPSAPAPVATVPAPVPSVVLPATAVRIERDYAPTLAELTTALEAARAKLAPETVRAIERNLQIVDDAIAEVRDALVRDPASAALLELFERNYRQKVDLLRRASDRAETT